MSRLICRGAGAAVGLSAIATLSYAKDSPKARTLEVQRALVVCRHGDRTPAFWANNKIGFQTITPEEKEFWSDSNSTIIPTSEQVETWRDVARCSEERDGAGWLDHRVRYRRGML